jgi:DNA adenine methylase
MKKLKAPIPWVGGKRLLRNHIISQIPEHHCYVEAFAGAGWVYWGKEPSHCEVLNDINGDLVNLYKQIKNNTVAFYDRLWYMISSRDEYHRCLALLSDPNAELSELERAVYYFFVIKNAFGGRFGSGFAFSKRQPPRTAIGYDSLVDLSERLSNTYIDNLPFNRIIKNYDQKETFFYLDPPYVVADGKDYYQYSFTEEQHIELRDQLTGIEGKFLLSYDDVPMIRDLYKNFYIEQTEPVLYTLNQKQRYKHELLIRNY